MGRVNTQRSAWDDGLGRAATRSAQVLLVLGLLVVVTYAALQIRLVVIPLLLATLIAAAASPGVDWLAARRFPRTLAVWTTLLAGFAVLGGAGWWIWNAVQDQWEDLAASAADGLAELRTYLASGPLPIDEDDLVEFEDRVREFVAGPEVQQGAIAGATVVVEVIAGLFLGLVLLFFLLRDGRAIAGFVGDQLPPKYRERWDLATAESALVLGSYVRGTAVIALVDAVLIGIALVIIGVPLALPLAVVVFFGAFVPLVGATVAGGLAALVALVSNGFVTALIVLAVVVAINQLEGDILAPYVLGQALSLHPLAILLALSAGTIVAGVIGALLAVPFAAVAWTVVKVFRAYADRDGPVDTGPEPAG